MHETMDFDVVIVGGGPAGLSTAIRLAQLAGNEPLNICVIDKGEEIGAHILSGAVLEPKALAELLPDWQQLSPPTYTPATHDEFIYLTDKKAFKLPTPPQMQNHGNFIISLSQWCRWLAGIAENLGVNIFPGFAATEIIYADDGRVMGIITGDKGHDRHGNEKPQYQPGMALCAKQVVFAEGCRGSMTKQLFKKFDLCADADPQTYGLGLKEIWELPEKLHRPGHVTHTIGWPLDQKTYGGSFAYHWGENLFSIGFVVGLDYENPYLNPYEEFQRLKTHPHFSKLLTKARRIAYGARTLIEGGMQSLPKLSFPGGVIVGDAAGFLNVPKIKGIHNAMKSGMVAAESIFPLLKTTTAECTTYQINIKNSWVWDDLYRARNIRPAFRFGLWPAIIYAAIDTYLFRGQAPWTLHHHRADHESLKLAANCKKINYPKHDNVITFDLPTSLFLANVQYDEDQPNHLKILNPQIPITVNLEQYAGPETRYCPAGVYEFLYNEQQQPRLQINNGNCIHCKACDIKDPKQNIVWTPSEGGSGPQYGMM